MINEFLIKPEAALCVNQQQITAILSGIITLIWRRRAVCRRSRAIWLEPDLLLCDSGFTEAGKPLVTDHGSNWESVCMSSTWGRQILCSFTFEMKTRTVWLWVIAYKCLFITIIQDTILLFALKNIGKDLYSTILI